MHWLGNDCENSPPQQQWVYNQHHTKYTERVDNIKTGKEKSEEGKQGGRVVDRQ